MEYEKLTTDELCEIITSKIGVPLPTYSYDYRKYVSVVPQNISFGDGVKGIENADLHDTFRNACMRIIFWDLENGG